MFQRHIRKLKPKIPKLVKINEKKKIKDSIIHN